MSDIFISYANEDRKRVQLLVQALEKEGWSVWWDRDIPTGGAFPGVIAKALNSAKAVIVVWTLASIKSDWVNNEARNGMKRGVLFPVKLLQDVQSPLEFEHLHTAHLTDWQLDKSHTMFDRFISDLAKTIGMPKAATPCDAIPSEKLESNLTSCDGISEKLFSNLGQELRGETVGAVRQTFRLHEQAWLESLADLQSTGEPTVALGWTEMLKVCIEAGQPIKGIREFLTTSESYTKSVTACLNMLIEKFPEKEVTLFFVTAMLPEQFYNWPQAEFSSHPYPEYISHTWTSSSDYLHKMDKLRNRVRLKRCILVKEDTCSGNASKKLPFCETIGHLRHCTKLHIFEKPIRYRQFETLHAKHLFQATAKFRFGADTDASYEKGGRLRNIEDFLFYPIGSEEEFRECDFVGVPLLENFIRELHSKEKADALYYVLRDTDINKLEPLFSDHSDLMPELAMFKVTSRGSRENQCWTFGLCGFLTPFTQSMRVRFLAGEQLGPYQTPLRYLEHEASYLTTLLNPGQLKKSFETVYGQGPTPWEQLPCNRESLFVKEILSQVKLDQVHSILDIGCGRGYGVLTMLLDNPDLNRDDVKVLGIDFASNAVRDAKALLEIVKAKTEPWPTNEGFPKKREDRDLRCVVEFCELDILSREGSDVLTEYDLVIDWMCFHEVPKANWGAYAELINRICKKWFVLNVFSRTGSGQLIGLPPAAPFVPRHQLSLEDIKGIFQDFIICEPWGIRDYPEYLNTCGDEEPIAAKYACILKRK